MPEKRGGYGVDIRPRGVGKGQGQQKVNGKLTARLQQGAKPQYKHNVFTRYKKKSGCLVGGGL